MKSWFGIICFFCLLSGARSQSYIFYLHGRIIEVQGANAVDSVNGYGAYKYKAILDSLAAPKNIVISEVRPKDTEVRTYAQIIGKQILDLIKAGTKPSHITVIGASKGSLIAMLVSGIVKNSDVNYVLMAACCESNLNSYPEIDLYGNILSIYEKSDFYGNCLEFKNKSKGIKHYKEIELHTGLRHGFFYQPISAWLNPSLTWASGDYR